MGVSDFSCMFVCAAHACTVSVESRKQCHIPWNLMVVSYHPGAGNNGT